MSRALVRPLLILLLLGATAAAFAVTEALKLEPPAISGTKTVKLFSPRCDCATANASIAFRLRRADRMTVRIVDRDGRVVRTLEDDVSVPAGAQLLVWDGYDAQDRIAPNGVYHVRVRLARSERQIQFPNAIRLDTTAPAIRLVGMSLAVLSPDGDGRGDKLEARYRLDERAHVTLYVDGRKAVGPSRLASVEGKLDWYGKVDRRALAPGLYRVTLVARDLAGNVSTPTAPKVVRLRFVSLPIRVLHVRAGGTFGVRVDTDARTVAWRLARRRGSGAPRPLVLRAPERAGRYTLVVRVGGHAARATVLVTPRG